MFASIREKLGYSEKQMEITEGQTLQEVWLGVLGAKEPPENVLMAINMDYANPDTKVKDGDEVAFFPPVTGG